MIKPMLATAAVAFTLLIGSTGVLVHAAGGQDRGGNRASGYGSDAQKLGYEHGYRDGGDRGRQDRDRGIGRNFTANDYLDDTRSYNRSFGDRREYMAGYRDGYQAGYDDGFNYHDRPGRYGQIYQDQSGRSAGRAGGPGPGTPFDNGYRGGVAAGQNDQRQNTRSDYRRSDAYRRGDATFQDGFERGYQDGYGRSRFAQDGGGYFPNRGNSGPADTRDGEGAQTRTITVPSTQLWTQTGIRVSHGDRIQFQSSGQIQIGRNANDRARTDGSLIQRFAPNSPIPKSLAGALIGRIDSGQAFGIGDQTSIVAPASGLLYLGINDDLLTDNSGEFRVVVSW